MGNRKRDQERYTSALATYAAHHFPAADPERAVEAVDQALRYGKATDEDSVRTFVGEHFDGIVDRIPEEISPEELLDDEAEAEEELDIDRVHAGARLWPRSRE